MNSLRMMESSRIFMPDVPLKHAMQKDIHKMIHGTRGHCGGHRAAKQGLSVM